ncbi:hypothetical protein [Pseudoalteromonas sp. S4389]|jgi:hypothetical protein|uniref:hypothetical protein n=1 Tax=Pseudoalteromonas sp. S4389 TaxID=579556 RepID=UPI0011095A5A|nr:hypothetical protein [Pseudoalteromonas sp. S4389]
MTTTIYDIYNKRVASDTRWSAKARLSDGNVYFFYTDIAKFEKIANLENAVLILAGNGQLIAQWKDWWFNSLDTSKLPETKDSSGKEAISLLIIDKKNNEVLFDAGHKYLCFCKETDEVISVFSGSGNLYAAQCWNLNRCTDLAIKTASTLDLHTSDIVKYVCFESDDNNVSVPNNDYNTIVDSMLTEGYFMELNIETAANDIGEPLSKSKIHDEIAKQLFNGDVVASAPAPGLSNFKWDEKNKSKFEAAIKKVKELESL